jgi:PRTRC genetic system protein B
VEILPQTVLVRTPEMLVWWSPARVRPMFFAEHADEAREIGGKRFPQPALVFKVSGHELWVRAIAADRRPEPGTLLKTAPYWNCTAGSGHVCQGTMRSPEDATSVDSIAAWERAFFQSRFTHASGAGRLSKYAGGFVALWKSLAGSEQRFPVRYLADCGETLHQFVERRDAL